MEVVEKIAERYKNIVDDADSFLRSLSEPLPRSFRINTLKAAPDTISRVRGYGIDVNPVEWSDTAFTTEDTRIGSTIEHFMGSIYFQETTSMIPPLAMADELAGAEMVLDCCAAPGSKTTQMSAMMGGRGTIVANDISYTRTKALKFNIEKTGCTNTVITNYDLLKFPDVKFDVVLLDAPCSLEGTVRKDRGVLRYWSERKIVEMSRIQKSMILKAFDLLADGGTLLYSTCTMAPEENEEVIQWLVDNRDCSVERIELEGLDLSKGVSDWRNRRYTFDTSNVARIWPHHNNTGGFFLAKVRKP